MNPTRQRTRQLSALLVVASLALAGCGEEDAGPSAAPSPTASPDPTTYCHAVFDLTAASDEDLGIVPEEATREEILDASIAWYGSDRADGLMRTALDSAPPLLARDTEVLVEGLRQFAEDGDAKSVGRKIGDSQDRIDGYLESECPEIVE